METQLNIKIKIIATIIVIVSASFLMLHTKKLSIELGLLIGAYIAIILVRDYIMKVDLHRVTGSLFLWFQLLLAFFIAILSEDFFAQVFILILIGEFTFYHSRAYSFIFTIVSYISFVLSVWIFARFPSFGQIYYIFPRVIEYLAIFGISLLAKLAFQQKNRLAEDNERLRIASIELAYKAKLQERTRISREIHDSVGHTLTSALTGLQTAAHAIEKSRYPLALEMIDRTRENILAGLDDVRTSVHLLREDFPAHRLIPELLELIDTTKKQTDVEIEYDIDRTMPELSPMIEIALYRALQEGLTNGIRHGSGTVFRFSLTHDVEHIRFVLSDNGKPPLQIVYGFGLNAMKERVEDVRGTMSLSRNEGSAGGLMLEITIPLQTEMSERSVSID
ncbi:MAG: sensor histidine kinase [Paenibacillus sp.]|jgi:signal transduction histidine kinase|nr:sensor histidine kinase [Paenibacillus sp.]